MTIEPVTPRVLSAAKGRERSVARLAGVQALYQIEMSGERVEAVIDEFLTHRIGHEIEGAQYGAADRDYFVEIVRGTTERGVQIDELAAGVLGANWTMNRLGALVRALLRAATFELLVRRDVPARVIIDEYVELARAFFSQREPAFVNGALDRLARQMRPGELPDRVEAEGDDGGPTAQE